MPGQKGKGRWSAESSDDFSLAEEQVSDYCSTSYIGVYASPHSTTIKEVGEGGWGGDQRDLGDDSRALLSLWVTSFNACTAQSASRDPPFPVP